MYESKCHICDCLKSIPFLMRTPMVKLGDAQLQQQKKRHIDINQLE